MFTTLTTLVLVSACQFAEDEQEVPAVSEIVKKAVAANGGEENLKKLRESASFCVHEATKLQGDRRVRCTIRIWSDFRKNQRRSETYLRGETKPSAILVADGEKGWALSGGRIVDVPVSDLEHNRQVMHDVLIGWVYPLLDQEKYKLKAIPALRENGRTLFGVLVQRKGYVDVRVYFDSKTFLLAKSIKTLDKNPGGPLTTVRNYSDYKKSNGTVRPHRLKLYFNNKKVYEASQSERKVLKEIPKALLRKPE